MYIVKVMTKSEIQQSFEDTLNNFPGDNCNKLMQRAILETITNEEQQKLFLVGLQSKMEEFVKHNITYLPHDFKTYLNFGYKIEQLWLFYYSKFKKTENVNHHFHRMTVEKFLHFDLDPNTPLSWKCKGRICSGNLLSHIIYLCADSRSFIDSEIIWERLPWNILNNISVDSYVYEESPKRFRNRKKKFSLLDLVLMTWKIEDFEITCHNLSVAGSDSFVLNLYVLLFDNGFRPFQQKIANRSNKGKTISRIVLSGG
eukprot:UN25563